MSWAKRIAPSDPSTSCFATAVRLLMRRGGVTERDIPALLGEMEEARAATSAETESKRAGNSPSNHNS
jgi:hypothetical protein